MSFVYLLGFGAQIGCGHPLLQKLLYCKVSFTADRLQDRKQVTVLVNG